MTVNQRLLRVATPANTWPLLLLFAGLLLTTLGYVVTVIGGWIDWAVWSPIALCSALLAWTTGSTIKRSAE
jgi:ribose/xylose/arabinose/galactoside ABC-type transport system permease subunit